MLGLVAGAAVARDCTNSATASRDNETIRRGDRESRRAMSMVKILVPLVSLSPFLLVCLSRPLRGRRRLPRGRAATLDVRAQGRFHFAGNLRLLRDHIRAFLR